MLTSHNKDMATALLQDHNFTLLHLLFPENDVYSNHLLLKWLWGTRVHPYLSVENPLFIFPQETKIQLIIVSSLSKFYESQTQTNLGDIWDYKSLIRECEKKTNYQRKGDFSVVENAGWPSRGPVYDCQNPDSG